MLNPHLGVDGEQPIVLGLLLLGLVHQWLVASDRYSIHSLSHLHTKA